MSPEFLRRAIHTPASNDPDRATAQTVEQMCRQIRTSAQDPLVQRCAHAAVEQFRGGPLWAIAGIDPFSDAGSSNAAVNDATRSQAIVESCFWWAKHNLHFVHHDELIYVLLGEVGQLQLLISPDVLVRMNHMEGDCAIYTMVVCAMLEVLNVPWEIVTLAVNPQEPEIFGHVFARAILSDGRRLPLDASHGVYPGWQVPAQEIQRLQVWDESGSPIADQGARFGGLHNYVRRRGFGTYTCDESDPPICTDDTTGQAVSMYDPLTQLYTTVSAAPIDASGNVTVPSQSSSQWPAALAALTKAGLTLAEINAIQPGTVVGANGQILRQAAGYAVPVGTSVSLTGGSGGTLLAIGALAIGLVLVLSMSRKS